MRPLGGSVLALVIGLPGCFKSAAPRLPPADPPPAVALARPQIDPHSGGPHMDGQQVGSPQGAGPQGAGPQVGQLAPDISGEDLDGVPFRLSDYRGKVILLDFWGHW